jgi:hypothetical protein
VIAESPPGFVVKIGRLDRETTMTKGLKDAAESREREEAQRAQAGREARAEPGDEAKNDARALQQMQEGAVDTDADVERIEDKR